MVQARAVFVLSPLAFLVQGLLTGPLLPNAAIIENILYLVIWLINRVLSVRHLLCSKRVLCQPHLGGTSSQVCLSWISQDLSKLQYLKPEKRNTTQPTPPMPIWEVGNLGRHLKGANTHCVVNKLDLLSLLEASRDEVTETNKKQWSEFADFTKDMVSKHQNVSDKRTNMLLATFGEGVTAQFGKLNHRVDKIEHEQDELKSDVKVMHVLISEVQEEQKRQREVLQMANNRAGISQSDLDSDDFFRPPNLEIVQITSPKYVSLDSIENAVKLYMDTQKISSEIWSFGR